MCRKAAINMHEFIYLLMLEQLDPTVNNSTYLPGQPVRHSISSFLHSTNFTPVTLLPELSCKKCQHDPKQLI
jgi:hypothetical protein